MKHAIILLTGAVLGCGGCVHFPYGMSLDRHNYVSTPDQPLTLTLVDTLSGQTVWELDIPINKMAVIDLDHNTRWTAGQSPDAPATRIRWGIFDPGGWVGMLNEKQQLTGNPVVLKVTVREQGEPYEPLNPKAGAAPNARGDEPHTPSAGGA